MTTLYTLPANVMPDDVRRCYLYALTNDYERGELISRVRIRARADLQPGDRWPSPVVERADGSLWRGGWDYATVEDAHWCVLTYPGNDSLLHVSLASVRYPALIERTGIVPHGLDAWEGAECGDSYLQTRDELVRNTWDYVRDMQDR